MFGREKVTKVGQDVRYLAPQPSQFILPTLVILTKPVNLVYCTPCTGEYTGEGVWLGSLEKGIRGNELHCRANTLGRAVRHRVGRAMPDRIARRVRPEAWEAIAGLTRAHHLAG